MNIYVGNLNYKATEEQLKEVFSAFGEVVSSKIIVDKATKRSKGFGFVEMTDNAAAQNAIDQLAGSEFLGRKLVVSQAREK
ncbi:MAG: RNA-binding protein [Salinivirgaceae bacterium]|nr:RNA-binding protein [Salinivirgaceae bacterium]